MGGPGPAGQPAEAPPRPKQPPLGPRASRPVPAPVRRPGYRTCLPRQAARPQEAVAARQPASPVRRAPVAERVARRPLPRSPVLLPTITRILRRSAAPRDEGAGPCRRARPLAALHAELVQPAARRQRQEAVAAEAVVQLPEARAARPRWEAAPAVAPTPVLSLATRTDQ